MPRRNRDYRYHRRSERRPRSALTRPSVQIGILLVVALIIFIILQSGGGGNNSLPREISMDDAYGKYQSGAFVLDMHTQNEWNEFHAPNTTLIPLDQLPARFSEVPHNQVSWTNGVRKGIPRTMINKHPLALEQRGDVYSEIT